MMTSTQQMTRAAAVARLEQLHQRTAELSAKHRQSKADEAELREIDVEFDELAAHVERLKRSDQIVAAGGNPHLRIERGGLTGDDSPTSGQRDSAMRTLDRSVKGGLPARAAEVVERLVETGPEFSRSWVSRWVTDTGSAEYRSAFAKLIFHGESRAALEWTAAERQAYDRVAKLQGEQRAMSLTDSSGGFLIPFELDPSIILVSAGSTNPLMSISRVITTHTDVWHGVSSAGVVASWDAEASEVSDDSPALAEPAIPAYRLACFVPFSIELEGDATALLSEVSKLMFDGATQLLNVALTTGTGTGSPTGIITALAGGSSIVAAGTADTLVAADVYNTQNSLGPRWQANARWAANLSILNTLRQFTTANGSLVFPELRDSTPTLLGRPVHELSNMDNTLGGGAGNDPVLLYGDFNNFVITSRVGSSVEVIPHLFGANQRPTGQRGLYMFGRYGSDSINDAAFRLLVA